MKRIYESILVEHFQQYRQMIFIAGPRQVGKTTTSQSIQLSEEQYYLNWDVQEHRQQIVQGPEQVAGKCGLSIIRELPVTVIFDEIHKYSKWKIFLKGFFDTYGRQCHIVVTGSGRLNIYKHGGDSLMGRYFLYRMHPLSVAEILRTNLSESEIRKPTELEETSFSKLFDFGGYPEPFLSANIRFYNRWRRLRTEQLFREDLRDLTRIQEIAQVEILAELMRQQAGQLMNYSTLANSINVSVDTIRRWITALESLYYCFRVRPWFKNIPKSLRKQPKVYLYDWSLIEDLGPKRENFIASHLLKAVHWWTDIGLGNYELHFLRDKDKNEVDFLVSKDNQPWFLVEVKSSAHKSISRSLIRFKEKTGAPHAFQVVFDLPYCNVDCFASPQSVIVPAVTFLSQLV